MLLPLAMPPVRPMRRPRRGSASLAVLPFAGRNDLVFAALQLAACGRVRDARCRDAAMAWKPSSNDDCALATGGGAHIGAADGAEIRALGRRDRQMAAYPVQSPCSMQNCPTPLLLPRSPVWPQHDMKSGAHVGGGAAARTTEQRGQRKSALPASRPATGNMAKASHESEHAAHRRRLPRQGQILRLALPPAL